MTVQTVNYPIAPAEVEPLKGTLLDAATVTEGIEWIDPQGLVDSFNCVNTGHVADWPCPTEYLVAPTMAAATTATTGGTLGPGTYMAVVTAITGTGETGPSNEVSIATDALSNTSTITFNWGDIAEETGYRLYVTAPNGASGSETLVVELAAGTTTYTWTGTPARGTETPPDSNTATIHRPKVFEEPSWTDGIRFAAYAGVRCKGIGFDTTDAEARIRRAFEAQESTAVEAALMQTRFRAAPAGSDWDTPTDITPTTGAVKPTVGLALLTGHAARNYAGTPTMHLPRTIVDLLLGLGGVAMENDELRTKLGAKIAAGAGYENNFGPDGTAPVEGEMWLYATGEVAVARGEVVQKRVLDTSSNDVSILVERPYVAAVDCYAAAVRVTVTA